MTELEKYKIALFITIRNSQVLPTGLELGKSLVEIDDMSYRTMLKVLCGVNFKTAKVALDNAKKSCRTAYSC